MSDAVRPRTGRAEKHLNQPAQLANDEHYDEDFDSGSEPLANVDDEKPGHTSDGDDYKDSPHIQEQAQHQNKGGTLSNWASRIMHKVLDSATAEIQSETEEEMTVSPRDGDRGGQLRTANVNSEEPPREMSGPASAVALPPATTTRAKSSSRSQSRSQSHASLAGTTEPAALPPLSDNPRTATASRAGSRAASKQTLLPPPDDSTVPLVGKALASGSSSNGKLADAGRASRKASRVDVASQPQVAAPLGRGNVAKAGVRGSGQLVDPKPPKVPSDKAELTNHRDGAHAAARSSPTSAEQSAAYQHALVLQLRAQIAKLKQQLGEREGAIDLLRAREAELRAASAAGPRTGHPIDKESRILYDRQKKAYQVLVQKLRREVRRLRFQRNSVADPLIETNYFPYLPRSVDGITARSLARTATSAARSTTSDHFAMNPPPATGNHPESGNRWWWGSGPSLASHLPRPKTAPVETSRNLHVRQRHLQCNGDGAPAPRVGDRVAINVRGQAYLGTLEYVGAFDAHPETGVWCGIALDLPVGKHDGVVQSKRYFSCEPGHGLFVKAEKTLSMGIGQEQVSIKF
ncbi:hypothetical protein HDU87_000455 [Geranomyces variabilis]|uniref:CAP-Gly domain-containing protein n=1 Tax=Geranomyces variabilis TaxID=109894 RepID=A0AAD5TNP6_9FUNG|nr:hypothetical protein HDU87_000455 [Geranomyces variabilis]